MKLVQTLIKYSTRIILGLFVVFALGFFMYLQSTRIDLKKLSLVQEETFDTALDPAVWALAEDGSFHYTGFYDNDQISISDKALHIKLTYKNGDAGNYLYASAVRSVSTYTSGYFEVKARLPKINEFNAVIALTNDEALNNTDPSQGAKIVFASSNNQPYPLLATGVYYDSQGEATETQNAFVASLVYGESHTYGLLYTPTSYTFYFDGYALWTTKRTPTSTQGLYLTFGFEFPYYTTKDLTGLDETLIIEGVKIYALSEDAQ